MTSTPIGRSWPSPYRRARLEEEKMKARRESKKMVMRNLRMHLRRTKRHDFSTASKMRKLYESNTANGTLHTSMLRCLVQNLKLLCMY